MKRVVLKIGTRVLSKEDKTLDADFLSHLVEQVVALRAKGMEVVLITSGAVGAGRTVLAEQEVESDTVQKQVFAAIGQVKLMSLYAELFSKYNYHCAQVLATKEDFRDETHYTNMQNCFEGLFLDSVVPIVNENDVVATTELMFTDNDELAGLVAEQLKADTLVILTSTNGILDGTGKTIPVVNSSNCEEIEGYISPLTSVGGRGGMLSKFTTARSLAEKGISVRIVDGRQPDLLLRLSAGEEIGTRFI